VDEVLAVGDAAFQKRCLGKMDEAISSQGRTVLFVSHNLGAVKTLTSKCLLISHGQLAQFGNTEDVVNSYLQEDATTSASGTVDLRGPEIRQGTGKHPALDITYESINLTNDRGQATDVFFEGQSLFVNLTFNSKIKSNVIELMVLIVTFDGNVVFSGLNVDDKKGIGVGTHETTCRFSPNPLRPGHYKIRLYIKSGHWQDVIPEAIVFRVEPKPNESHELMYGATNPLLLGLVRAPYDWSEIHTI
jgi:lipopolysaccharide transport system ATP-binding protein